MSSLFQRAHRNELTFESSAPQEMRLTSRPLDALERELFERLPHEALARLILENPIRAQRELNMLIDNALSEHEFNALTGAEAQALRDAILERILGLGPVERLLKDPSVSEIMVNGPHDIFFEREGVLFRSERSFASEEELRQRIDQIIAPLGRRLDERSPVVNARLKEGHRVHAIIPPLALNGPVLTIRKFRNETFTLEALCEREFMPRELVALLRACVYARKNIAVSGGTGSGKTTFLNTLSQEISPRERIITIEDSAELRFSGHPHVVRLESRTANLEGEGAVTLRDLVINSLRMRPDRIVVGEVRGAEALEMLQAMNTGHDGSMTTLHANSEHEVASRLMTMVGYGAHLPADQVLAQISSALDVIVHLARRRDGLRLITSVSLVAGQKDGALLLEPLYRSCSRRDGERGQWTQTPQFFRRESFVRELQSLGALEAGEARPWVS